MKLHTLSTVAALFLAGSLSAVQAQTSTPQPAPAGQAVQPSTQPSPTTAPTHPSGDPTPGAMHKDEAVAIQAAREKCKSAGSTQAQQACMSQAQQDYQRSKPSGSMQPGRGAAGDGGSGSGAADADRGSATGLSGVPSDTGAAGSGKPGSGSTGTSR